MTAPGRPSYPHVHQINVSDGGVPKKPIREAKLTERGVEGDRQRNLKVHGGPDRAVCLYSLELLERLQGEGHPIHAGSSGGKPDACGSGMGDDSARCAIGRWPGSSVGSDELHGSLQSQRAMVSERGLSAHFPEKTSDRKSVV